MARVVFVIPARMDRIIHQAELDRVEQALKDALGDYLDEKVQGNVYANAIFDPVNRKVILKGH